MSDEIMKGIDAQTSAHHELLEDVEALLNQYLPRPMRVLINTRKLAERIRLVTEKYMAARTGPLESRIRRLEGYHMRMR